MATDHPDSDFETFRSGEVTCRKAHPCTGCPDNGAIHAGERAFTWVGLNAGHFEIQRTCIGQPCHARQSEDLAVKHRAEVAATAPRGPDDVWF